MNLNRIFTIATLSAALLLTAGSLFAQNEGGPGGDGGGDGGGRRQRGGGPGGGNFDPAQFQQRIMERLRENLGFTNDTDWNAVEPLVQKVMDARRDVSFGGGMGRLFMGRSRSGNNTDNNDSRRGGMFGNPGPEAEALQKAVDDNAPAAQIKDLLAKYTAAQKAKQAKLEKAQADLRRVLSVKQEAEATLSGLL